VASRETTIHDADDPSANPKIARPSMRFWAGSQTTVGQRIRTLSDSPMMVALVTGVGGLVFVVARLTVAAHGDVSVFIVVGSTHASPRLVPQGIAIVKGTGYDGQFYYRMALDPADLSRTAFGIRLDSVSRLERIGYPAIAWVLAAGRPSLVPDSLVITNVLALGALGYGGGLLARDSGRHAMWGATLAGFWGYLWSAGRDLTEITAAAFLILGLLAYRRHRWVLAGLLLLAAVLTKETAAYVVVVIAATRLVGWAVRRDRQPLTTTDVAWVLPLLGFAAWQAVVFAATGSTPLLSSGQANLSLPFVGMIDGLRHCIAGLPSTASLIWIGELTLLIALAVAAGVSIRRSSAPVHERLAWVAVVFLAICTAPGIWLGDVGFRSLDDVYLFSWIVLLGTPKRLWPFSGLVGCAWIVVAIELALFV
jgi:hypothetical protein